MNNRTLHDRVVVHCLDEGEQQVGGIIIPEAAARHHHRRRHRKTKDDGKRVPVKDMGAEDGMYCRTRTELLWS